MSEKKNDEKIDIKKLPLSKAVTSFMDEKYTKKELKDAYDKDDFFKHLSYSELSDVLYFQKRNSSFFPKELRIKSADILYQYGRNINASYLMNFASEGYVSELDVLKALGKTEVLKAVAVVTTAEKKEEKTEPENKDNPQENKDKKSKDKEDDEDDVIDDKDENNDKKVGNEFNSSANSKKEEFKGANKQDNAGNASSKTQAPEVKIFSKDDLLDVDRVKLYFTADKLIRMFFARKMTREFIEKYQEVFKDDAEYTSQRSKEMIKELKEILSDNVDALYTVIIRLHFRGMILAEDVKEEVKSEFFKEKISTVYDTYDVLDRDGNVIYSFNKDSQNGERNNSSRIDFIDNFVEQSSEVNLDIEHQNDEEVYEEEDVEYEEEDVEYEEEDVEYEEEDVEYEEYSILEPITRDEVIESYRDDNVDDIVMGLFFTDTQLIEMYRNNQVSVKVFKILNEEKRKQEILNIYKMGSMPLEDIMELYFVYSGISTEVLKEIIQEIPQRVSIINFIPIDIKYKKIYELYKYKLIDFYILSSLKWQGCISDAEYKKIIMLVNKDEFYESIESAVFYTSKPKNEEDLPKQIEISDTERVLLSKIMGISDEEIADISIIYSKTEDGEATILDGYHIISDKRDGLVIFGKFDYESPIYVMTYEEAAYYLRSRDEEDRFYIYEDLLFSERLERNEQVKVIKHDEDMANNIVQAMCDLSEKARSRYRDDESYMNEVLEYIREITEEYKEKFRNTDS